MLTEGWCLDHTISVITQKGTQHHLDVCNNSSTFPFCYHFCQVVYTCSFTPTYTTTQNALQRNAARQTQRSIGNECTSDVPKRHDAVGVIEA
jgi:hypothetical protein